LTKFNTLDGLKKTLNKLVIEENFPQYNKGHILKLTAKNEIFSLKNKKNQGMHVFAINIPHNMGSLRQSNSGEKEEIKASVLERKK
jgi:hypothetical protein